MSSEIALAGAFIKKTAADNIAVRLHTVIDAPPSSLLAPIAAGDPARPPAACALLPLLRASNVGGESGLGCARSFGAIQKKPDICLL